MSDTMLWKPSHDDLLRNWRKQATINLWLCLASAYYYERINTLLVYPAVICSAGISIGVFGIESTEWGKYLISVVSLVSGILTTVNKQVRAAEKCQDFELRAKDYYKVIRDIDYMLAMDIEDRGGCLESLLKIRDSMDRIMDMQIEPPLNVIREYEKKFKPIEAAMFEDFKDEDIAKSSEGQRRPPDTPRGMDRLRNMLNRIVTPSPTSPMKNFANLSSPYPSHQRQRVFTESIVMTPYQLFCPPLRNNMEPMPTPLTPTTISQQASLQNPQKTIDINNINNNIDLTPESFNFGTNQDIKEGQEEIGK